MTLEMVTIVRKFKKKHVIQLYQNDHILKQPILKIGLMKKIFFGIFVIPRVQPFRKIHSQLCSIL